MSYQTESALEAELIKQLCELGHSLVNIPDEAALVANLKTQLEKHNQVSLTNTEFTKVLNHLNKGNVFERAKILRDRMSLQRDNGEVIYLEFMNLERWCQNQFQVAQQVTQEGSYINRYDVTLLINGLPLVQIELKRRGLELKEAFNQINRYHRHSFSANYGLYQYVQLFVISNGVNTKYYANNKTQSFKQTFYWADEQNHLITQLSEFTQVFLEPCHIAKMIAKYVVLNETDKILMVLRPYQYYATEAIVEQVKNNPKKNGYIWHTTGSGKTLTSFKTSQILTKIPKVHKVVFVVDRKDLDYQTIREFNSFAKGSIDGTDNTVQLVKQFTDDNCKLIVTTLQKLNVAISKSMHLAKMEPLKNKRIIFIFDECHRSQFGETHKKIKEFFTNHQMFGFTGTPIFADNAANTSKGQRTTKDLFAECLHKYVITDAIRDENVLKFLIEYIGRYSEKLNSRTFVDIEVENIDTKELLEHESRLAKIVDYIIANHERKTHNKKFNAIFCVSSIETLCKYYYLFKQAALDGKHNLKIATIFSYGVNENDVDANGFALDSDAGFTPSLHLRDHLEGFIADYNAKYGTKFSTKDNSSKRINNNGNLNSDKDSQGNDSVDEKLIFNYFTDLSRRIKDHANLPADKQVDILLVVNMFLTGFDSKTINTLYVDKNLKYHGLVQAFSRTNRIFNEQKSHGNIVCFRNLKKATDEAIGLFSNKDANEDIIVKPYEDYVEQFNQAAEQVKLTSAACFARDHLATEEDELAFIKDFRDLMRLKNILMSFSGFSFDKLGLTEQEFEDYKSRYLDLYHKVKSNTAKEKVSILDDVDFELELIQRDEINVSYILKLLINMHGAPAEAVERQTKEVSNLLSGEVKLRSKKELIERFINEQLPTIEDSHDIPERFDEFWDYQKQTAIKQLCEEEKLVPEKVEVLIGNYMFTEKKPINNELEKALTYNPSFRDRLKVLNRVWDKVTNYVNTFIDGVDSN